MGSNNNEEIPLSIDHELFQIAQDWTREDLEDTEEFDNIARDIFEALIDENYDI